MEILSYLMGKNASSGGGGDLDWSALGYDTTPEAIQYLYNESKKIQDEWVPAYSIANKYYNNRMTIMPLVDMSSCVDAQNVFYYCERLLQVPLLDTSNITNMRGFFLNCSSLLYVPVLNTSKVTNFANMFSGCSKIEEVPLLDSKRVTTFQNMFNNCTKLKTVPVFDMTSASSLQGMFSGCPALSDTSLDNILKMCSSKPDYAYTKTLAYLGFSSTNYPAERIQALPHYQDFLDASWTIGY